MEEHVLQSLTRLGLTNKEAEAYCVLVAEGKLTAKEIAERIKTRHPIVYRTLQRLESGGWIYATSERPKHYAPQHPKEAARTMLRKIEREGKEAAEAIEMALSPIYRNPETIIRREIVVIKTLQDILERIQDFSLRTHTRLDIQIAGFATEDVLKTLIQPFLDSKTQIHITMIGPPVKIKSEAIKNRVHIEYPLEDSSLHCLEHAMRIKRKMGKGERYVFLTTVFMTFDRRETIWINLPYIGGRIVEEKVWANWITDPDFVRIITGWF